MKRSILCKQWQQRIDMCIPNSAKALGLILLLWFTSLAMASTTPEQNLTIAFQRAFSDSELFSQTNLFPCLGYTASQSRAMVEITPRPASLIVTCVPGSLPGEYDQINVIASSIHYYGLTIAQASFSFPMVRLDAKALSEGRLVFHSVSEIAIHTRVSEDDLLKVFPFSARSRQLSNLRLQISKKAIEVRGRVRKGLFLASFHLCGKPVLNGSKRIDFACSRMVLNGVSLPRAAIRAILNQVNPVFDATNTWLNLELSSINIEPGFVCTNIKLCRAEPAGTQKEKEAAIKTLSQVSHSAIASVGEMPLSER